MKQVSCSIEQHGYSTVQDKVTMKNRTLLKTIGLIVAVCTLLAACDMPVINNNLREPTITIADIPGEVRSLSADPGGEFVRLTWTDPTDTDFDHAEISYSANNGSIQILPPVGKGVQTFTIPYLKYGTTYAITVKLVDINGNKSLGSLIIVTMPRVVDDLDLAQYITAPAANALPDTQLIRGPQYTTTSAVTWTKSPSGSFSGAFEEGTAYRAMVTLMANPGCTFDSLGANSFTYAGASVIPGANGRVTITFPVLSPAWYVASHGNDSATGNDEDHALNTVDKALEKIAIAYRAPHTWTHADIIIIGTSGDKKTITIDDTEDKDNSSGGTSTDEYPLITLRGLSPAKPGILTADKSDWSTTTYRVLYVRNGAQVTLGNDLTITGGGKLSHDELGGSGVYVRDGSSFIMNGGTVTGNTTYTTGGSGVVRIRNSTFTMNSGIISNNYGFFAGGVAAQNSSIFTMTGGVITKNDSYSSGGGVRITDGSSFIMSGGTISANKTSESGTGGGVFIYNASSFIMSGGAITSNTSPRSGGGVEVADSSTFIMDNGTISDNITNEYGGGVNLGISGISFTMRGGTIAGNTARSGGGGVGVLGGIFKKQPVNLGDPSGIIYSNDGTVNRNKATLGEDFNDKGHAVYIYAGPKKRETTVGSYQSLDSAVAGPDGGWVE
jgi:hypothetical protein